MFVVGVQVLIHIWVHIALFKALSTLAAIVADFGNSCRIRRQSPFSASVAVSGDAIIVADSRRIRRL